MTYGRCFRGGASAEGVQRDKGISASFAEIE
jgi:hypothetical protein